MAMTLLKICELDFSVDITYRAQEGQSVFKYCDILCPILCAKQDKMHTHLGITTSLLTYCQ